MENDILNPLLEKYKKNIMKDTIKKIYEKYSIYDEDNLVNEMQVIEYVKKLNNQLQFKKRCCGISRSKQCTKNSIENYDYCKSHIMIYEKNYVISSLAEKETFVPTKNIKQIFCHVLKYKF